MSAVDRLRQHFASIPAEKQAEGWNAMWQESITPWDRSAPNSAFIDTLDNKSELLGSPWKDDAATQRKRALVPGCGRGYDVLLLASHGYDAYGLDTSSVAIERANELREKEADDPQAYPTKDIKVRSGRASFLQANFFKDDFLKETGEQKFDLIYDYTFLCALPPELRPQWAKRMSDLLDTDGRLVCLEFPLQKDPKSGGPPHGLSSQLYVELFRQPGADVEYDNDGHAVAKDARDTSKAGLGRVAHWQSERKSMLGPGSDVVSVWRHFDA